MPQQVIFSAADGLEIHGQLFFPQESLPASGVPRCVFFHGGSQRQMLLGWHYMEYYSNAYAMNQYLAIAGLHRAERELPQRHRLRAQLPRGAQLRRIRRKRIQRCDGRGALPEEPTRRGWRAHRLVGRQLRRLSDCAGAGACIQSFCRRRRHARRARLEPRDADLLARTTIRASMPRPRAWRSNRRPCLRSPRGARRCC